VAIPALAPKKADCAMVLVSPSQSMVPSFVVWRVVVTARSFGVNPV
jgi:hypothetical protein